MKLGKTIVLPDGEDPRVWKAARILTDEKIAHALLLGNETAIRSKAGAEGVHLEGVRIIDPSKSDRLGDFGRTYFNLRKSKGMQFEEAGKVMLQPLFFGAMMVKEGMADGSVAGSLSTTGDVLRDFGVIDVHD